MEQQELPGFVTIIVRCPFRIFWQSNRQDSVAQFQKVQLAAFQEAGDFSSAMEHALNLQDCEAWKP